MCPTKQQLTTKVEENLKLPTLTELMSELKAPFDKDQERDRPGPKKKVNGSWVQTTFKYIPTIYVSERLDDVFPLQWSWEVLASKSYECDKEVNVKDQASGQWGKETKTQNHLAVLGRLSLILPDRSVVFRDAWGGSELDKGTQAADGYKIADSNAFKKAAYKFGVAVYLGIEGLEADLEAETQNAHSYSNNQNRGPKKSYNQGSNTNQGQQDSNPFL